MLIEITGILKYSLSNMIPLRYLKRRIEGKDLIRATGSCIKLVNLLTANPMFDHFVGLALKGFKNSTVMIYTLVRSTFGI